MRGEKSLVLPYVPAGLALKQISFAGSANEYWRGLVIYYSMLSLFVFVGYIGGRDKLLLSYQGPIRRVIASQGANGFGRHSGIMV